MRIRRSGRLAVVPLLLLTSAACAQQAGGAGSGEADSPERSYSADTVVFRMDHTGGFVTPAMLATRLPMISVYGDGRVITQGPVNLIFPGPALPNLQVGRISATEVDELLKAARAAGVGSGADLGRPPISDAPSTRFTVLGDNGAEEFEVYALAESGDVTTGLSADQRAGRDKLREFAESLTAESGPLAAAQADQQPYAPSAVAAVAEPWAANADAGEQPEVTWPGPALPGADLAEGTGLGCVTATGDEAQQVLTAAASANTATPWVSDGKRWTVTLRPLLPDETDCGDLTTNR
ncbi:hypothetical protein ACLQ2S_08305 [Micromonospora sp. DT48]|uniref:hypothetical protein n=1 Tax=unclassified Micromonospora TaxID=2617518 RepID=UPI0012BBF5A5|nr:hypothetical protein [Micromonospora sp. CP22]MTK02399.1 hypothetical protein [Micromonospora sp. CP22]